MAENPVFPSTAHPDDLPPKLVSTEVPRGSILKNYGPAIGIAGSAWGVMSFLADKPGETFKLLGQFGPKWLFFMMLIYVLWDLLKRLLHQFGLLVGYIGQLATNTGKVAAGVDAFASKTDRTSEEMQRMTTFSVQTSQRSVEIAQETLAVSKANSELLQQILSAKQVTSA